jgi:amino acid transporter
MNKPAQEAQNNQKLASSPVKEIWLGTCARYTVLTLLILFFGMITSESLTVTYVDTVSFFLLLPLGFCFTLATRLRKADRISATTKCILHPLLVLGGGYFCFYLPYQVRSKPSGGQALIMILLGVILYVAVMAVVLLVSRKARQKKIDNTPYVSQYGNRT